MGTNDTEDSGFSFYAIIAILMAATGVFYIHEPLKSFRPKEPIEKATPIEAEVGARLWQDPIAAVRRHQREISKRDPERIDSKSYDPLLNLQNKLKSLSNKKQRVLIFPVIVSGCNTVYDHEMRLRTRYAILAALDTAGYTPSR